MYTKHFSILLILAGLFFSLTSIATANPVRHDYSFTEVEIFTKDQALIPGQTTEIVAQFRLDPHWHVYWKNAGDSGLPPKIEWTLPEGFSLGEKRWPTPMRIVTEPFMTYGYENVVNFIMPLNVPKTLALNQEYTISAKVSWLACKTECVPGKATLVLTLPSASSSSVNPAYAKIQSIDFPQTLLKENIATVYEYEEYFDLQIKLAKDADINITRDVYYFPEDNELIDHVAEQKLLKTSADDYVLRIIKSELYSSDTSKSFVGVLKNEDKSFSIAPELKTPPNQSIVQPVEFNPSNNGSADATLLLAIAFAFIGGLILNLMPCVLPVLSIKILHLIEQTNSDRRESFKYGLYFTSGIVFTFWILAGSMLILKATGKQIGWGFQFQSPSFLIVLSMLFVLMGLNLFGLFEIGASLTTLGAKEKHKISAKNSFLNGMLTTIVATPCTAPFMGSALGFALVKPPIFSFFVFTFLGLGLAMPYLLLSLFPSCLKFLPKPGPWMITLKKFFSILFFATAGWLAWVLWIQRGTLALIWLFIGFLFVVKVGFVLKRWGSVATPAPKRRKAYVLSFFLICVAFFVAWYGAKNSTVSSTKTQSESGIQWIKYTPDVVEQLRAENRIVFLDFTASWCLSCQVNEHVALKNAVVIEKFKELNIAAVKADWTNYDEDITKALESFGKSSIPFYVIYPREKDKDWVILPEIITPGIVIDALEKM